jgi:hypothetical protein
VPRDYFVRFDSADADRGSKEETNSHSVAHRCVPALLRFDDDAYRRTRLGHSIAAQSHQNLDVRQRRTVDHEGKGRRRSANGADESSGPRASSVGANAVDPDSFNPGSTAAPFPRPYRQDREASASTSARTRCGFGRSTSHFANDLAAQVSSKRPRTLFGKFDDEGSDPSLDV